MSRSTLLDYFVINRDKCNNILAIYLRIIHKTWYVLLTSNN